MKKFILALTLTMSIMTLGKAYAAGEIVGTESDITIMIDGGEYEGEDKPVIINGRTYLPLRAMSEAMGA